MKTITIKLIFSAIAILLAASLYSNNLEETYTNRSSVLLAPSITSFSPTSGAAGTSVTVFGNNFSAILSDNIAEFNGIAATVTSATENILTVLVPATATTGAVNVRIGSQQTISSSVFTVLTTTTCNGLSVNNSKYWYFGNNAAIKFESGGPVALTDSAMGQVEGVATMSDSNGNLLFYTNGITIYNRNHQTMQNGSGLLSNSSNTQAAFVVPFPGNPNQYFVITPGSYYYSIVDMTLDNGNGAIVPNAKNILITNENSEKVAGLLTSNQIDIWLITYGSSQRRFNTYRITPSGLTTTAVVSQFAEGSGYFGYMKISPDETKIVMANFNQSFHLYDFDAATGIVSNQRVINFTPSIGGFGSYGIEFSPNSELVYVADHRGGNKVHQFDIMLPTPELINSTRVALASNTQALGALQLGPDNKIYLAKEGSGFLGVINQPNVAGLGCDFISDAINLAGKTSNLGLPGFVASAITRSEPYITAFSPTIANIGETVAITGLNFNSTLSNNYVEINGIPAVVTAATDISLTVVIPETATTGKISIAVGCGLVATTNDLIITNLDINEANNMRITVYPNPSNGLFHFTAINAIANKIEVHNLLGTKLLSINNFDLNATLDLSHLSSGAYLISITQNDLVSTKKILKK